MEQVAALSYEASGSALTSAQNRFLSKPQLEFPCYLGILLIIGGIRFLFLFADRRGGEPAAVIVFLASTLIGWVLLRISLARENDNEPKLISTRIALGYITFLFALPALFLPGILTFAGWLEYFGESRSPGNTLWLRDFAHVASCIVITSSITWLFLLAFHAVLPRVLTFVFKPLIHPWSLRRTLFSAVVLVGLLAVASFAITRLSYLPYERGDVRDQPRPGLYTPRDDKQFQKDLRAFDTKQKREREIPTSELSLGIGLKNEWVKK